MHTFFCSQNNTGAPTPSNWAEGFAELPELLQRAFPLVAFWGLSIDEVSELFCVPPTLFHALEQSLVVKNHGA